MIEIDGKKYYRTSEACKMAGISRATLFRWLKSGTVKDTMMKDRRGWRLFSEKDIKLLKDEANKVIAGPLQRNLNFNQ